MTFCQRFSGLKRGRGQKQFHKSDEDKVDWFNNSKEYLIKLICRWREGSEVRTKFSFWFMLMTLSRISRKSSRREKKLLHNTTKFSTKRSDNFRRHENFAASLLNELKFSALYAVFCESLWIWYQFLLKRNFLAKMCEACRMRKMLENWFLRLEKSFSTEWKELKIYSWRWACTEINCGECFGSAKLSSIVLWFESEKLS